MSRARASSSRGLTAAVCLALANVAATAAPSESERLNLFFEAVFARDLARSPITQSRLGIRTSQDRWDDVSERRQVEDAALLRGDLKQLRRYDRSKLTPAAQLSYRLFEREADAKLQAFRWRHCRYLITQMGGLHTLIATTLLNNHPIVSRDDAEDYIARLAAVRPLLAQLVTELERQEASGVQPPRFVYPLTIGAAENLVTGRPFDDSGRDSPVFADFKSKLATTALAEGERAELIERAASALREGFGPGYRRLIAHLQKAQRRATDEAGVWKLPQGTGFYRHAIEQYTTLPIAAEELHQLGLEEVARLQAQMRETQAVLGHSGSLPEFFEQVRNDPNAYYEDTPQGRAQYLADANAMLAQARSRQHEIMNLPLEAKVVVRAVEPWREKSAAKAFYQGAPQDGSRPAIFYVNLYDMRAAPKYQLAVVLYHEAIPGHHIETTIAHELPEAPSFRKFAGVAAFSEGWGLYSELLAKEMGLYHDPYQDFGRVSLALLRAARLVVDTGLHAKRWTREQAIEYLDRTLPGTHYDNQREIDRYIVLPGQATSYAVGMLKLIELRQRARDALGERFDLKAFHDLVLGSGPLPLPILEEQVAAWIAARRVP